MLKLQLSCGSDVFVGNTIKIVVRRIDAENNTVELGFYAPKEVKILRGSLLRSGKRRDGQDTPSNGKAPGALSESKDAEHPDLGHSSDTIE